MLRVKICGITNLEDALACVGAGADALGFVFAPSQRQIQPKKAKEIIEKLPPWIASVAVFQNESKDNIHELKAYCKFTWIQLHGNESKDFAAPFSPFVIKAIWNPKEIALDYPCSAYLVDQAKESPMPQKEFLKMASQIQTSKPLILGGGLTPENVEETRSLKIYGVDVARGVENSPGKKDVEKVKLFIRKAKGL